LDHETASIPLETRRSLFLFPFAIRHSLFAIRWFPPFAIRRHLTARRSLLTARHFPPHFPGKNAFLEKFGQFDLTGPILWCIFTLKHLNTKSKNVKCRGGRGFAHLRHPAAS
jgi:hypothetical protein